jgi:RimJ/RimL family protein N-acetyltransferase
VLEPLLPVHAARTFALWQDERLYTFIPLEPPANALALEERYRKLAAAARRSPEGKEGLNWFARDKATGDYVALIQVTIRPDAPAYLAYITFAAHWRRGYAYEGCQAVIRWLFGRGTDEIEAEMDVRNTASLRLIEKLGFRRVAFTPKAAQIRGADSDEYRYALTVPRKSAP